MEVAQCLTVRPAFRHRGRRFLCVNDRIGTKLDAAIMQESREARPQVASARHDRREIGLSHSRLKIQIETTPGFILVGGL